MKDFLLSTLFIGVSIFVGNAQDFITVSYNDIEGSKEYITGNDYQKDLLLYSKTLELTHPYYADSVNVNALRSMTMLKYEDCAHVADHSTFRTHLQEMIYHLDDGHTQVATTSHNELIYPLYLMFDTKESAYVLAIEDDYKSALGKRVALINDKPLSDIISKAHKLISGDNEVFKNKKLSNMLQVKSFWEKCGYRENHIRLTFEDSTSITIPATTAHDFVLEQLSLEFNSPTVPREVPFYYQIFDSLNICYLQFNICFDSLNYPQLGQRFDDFIEGMMADIKARSIGVLVIDVRNNGGGNSALCDLLLSYLTDFNQMKNMGCKVRMSELLLKFQPNFTDVVLNNGSKPQLGDVFDLLDVKWNNEEEAMSPHRINRDPDKIFKGNVIFISGRGTFSSAGLLLTLARDNGIGTIIGETPGHRPSHYGDILQFSLPNTGIKATVSCRYISRPNEQLNEEKELVPDVLLNLSDYTKPTDAAWDWIIEHYH